MTSYKRLAFSLFAVLLLSLPMFGQYTSTYTEGGADVLNSTYSPISGYNCASDNCWVTLGTNTFTQFTASSDGEVQAIDAGGNRWHWVISSGAWVELSDGIAWKNFHIGSLAGAYYLGLSTSGSGNAYNWNGSSWVQLGSTTEFVDGAVSASGDMYGIGTAGGVWHWNGTAWTQIRNSGESPK